MLKNLIQLKKGDILSIVGSGGKTTTMFSLAKEISKRKVLLTTSVKIFRDTGKDFITIDNFNDFLTMNIKDGVYLSGNTLKGEKFTGIDCYDLIKVKNFFDYIIIESDGAKNMSLTGWRKHEPVILKNSNKTLGIIPIDILGKQLNDIDIFEKELFQNIVGKDKNTFDIECIYNLIISKDALFRNSNYEKYILLNKCDNYKVKNDGKNIANILNKESKVNGKIKVIYGSSKKGVYYED